MQRRIPQLREITERFLARFLYSPRTPSSEDGVIQEVWLEMDFEKHGYTTIQRVMDVFFYDNGWTWALYAYMCNIFNMMFHGPVTREVYQRIRVLVPCIVREFGTDPLVYMEESGELRPDVLQKIEEVDAQAHQSLRANMALYPDPGKVMPQYMTYIK